MTINNYDISQLQEVMLVQQKVRERFQPDVRTRDKARAYSQLLFEHFGLATNDVPRLDGNPALAAYLDSGK